MAHGFMLQDWLTLTGVNSQVIVQPEADYAQLPGFQDVACYLEVSNLSNTNVTNIDLQTSPTKDEVLFGASQTANPYLVRYGLSSASAAGVQLIKVARWASAADQLLAEFIRWKVTFPSTAGPTTLTFRIWLSLNQAGWP